MADLPQDETREVVLVNGDGTTEAIVNSDGSINVQPNLSYQVTQGNVYTLSGSFNAAVGGSDNALLLVRNPNGSGKTLRLKQLLVGCIVNNVGVEYKLFYAPTITSNGTAATARNNLIGSANASVALCTSLPTLSSIGTQILDYSAAQNTAADPIELNIDVPANQTIVVSAAPVSNNRAIAVTLVWMEV